LKYLYLRFTKYFLDDPWVVLPQHLHAQFPEDKSDIRQATVDWQFRIADIRSNWNNIIHRYQCD